MKKITLNPFQLLLLLPLLLPLCGSAQIGDVIWEDNFDNFNTAVWNPNEGDGCAIGLCGWGNQELQSYNSNNITIESIPGESGNNALVLQAKNESSGSSAFTSGKVDSDGNLSVQYGMIEIRMRTPNLNTGLWPAAWLLGTANTSWPGKGEIDMMEMGHAAAERERQGHAGVDMNRYVGANAIFANDDGSVGSIAFDVNYNQPYIASTSMANRFVTYRLYWEPTQMRYTVIDNGVEYDLYTNPLPLNPDGVTGVFNKPFYFLLNLAVGGNFTDAESNNQVTAPLPSKLYIDYVRVHKWNGFGTVETDYSELETETGTFGVFTENTPTNNELTYGSDAEIYVWGATMQDGNTAAAEGSEVIAWETVNANSWFGGGISALFGRDMSGYVENGSLKFKIKVPANVSFRIGITDNFTNERWITFPANETKYGLVRNGDWGLVEIPLIDFSGLIAFQNINYMFAISSDPTAFPSATFQMGIDDIVWHDGDTSLPPPPPVSDNLALNGDASQSTTRFSGNANRAIDGNTNGVWGNGSVTHTANAPNQWWQVDISANKAIGDINIFNRTNCCTTRLTNFTVSVINSNGTTTFSKSFNQTPSPSVTLNAGGAIGSIIKVALDDTNPLSLAEVEVFEYTGTVSTIFPDPNKTYYIDSPIHNLRIAANGSSENPYTTSTATTGDDVTWKFVDRGNGYWQIERVAGGTKPRLRSRNSADADMQPTSSNGGWTYYHITEGFIDNTYFLTLPDGPTNYHRLQVNNNGQVKMVTKASANTWESFSISETGISLIAVLANYVSPITSETVKAYPVPASSELNLYIPNPGDYTSFDIIDLTGKKISSQKESIKSDNVILIESLPNGYYLIRLNKADGSSETIKFVK